MGGYYLDILKDRMYTMPMASRGRRSAQTTMFHILQSLVRWLAPILSFTAEEIWRYLPGTQKESVFLEKWYVLPAISDGAMDMTFWNDVIRVRQVVGKELEKLRVAGGIGSGLDAEVDIYCDSSWQERLGRLGDELRFVLITSYARVHSLEARSSDIAETEIKGLHVQVGSSAFPKCIRCWQHREDVGINKDHPQICGRCVQNITGPGELRGYA